MPNKLTHTSPRQVGRIRGKEAAAAALASPGADSTATGAGDGLCPAQLDFEQPEAVDLEEARTLSGSGPPTAGILSAEQTIPTF